MFHATSIHFYLLLYHVCSTLRVFISIYYCIISIYYCSMFHATSIHFYLLLYHAYSPRYEYSFLSIIVPWFLSYVVASKRTRRIILYYLHASWIKQQSFLATYSPQGGGPLGRASRRLSNISSNAWNS